jgi:hypothetical protein
VVVVVFHLAQQVVQLLLLDKVMLAVQVTQMTQVAVAVQVLRAEMLVAVYQETVV